MTKRTPRTAEQKLHIAVVSAAAVLAVGMVGAAAWALTRPLPPGAIELTGPVPAAESSQTAATATFSANASGTTAAPAPTVVAPAVTPTTPSTTTPASTRRIAFHIGGKTLYVAGEDGKNKSPMHVVGTNYALSPDGTTVAAIENGKLLVAAVGEHLLATAPVKPGLTAEAVPPVWLPNSSAVLFVRSTKNGSPHVWLFNRQSGTTTDLGVGAGAAISPDGQAIVKMPAEDEETPAIVVGAVGGSGGTSFRITTGDVVAIAASSDRVFVSTVTTDGVPAIWSFSHDGKSKERIVGSKLVTNTSVTYGELMLSPDGKKLLFAADGDDGYSRLWIVPTAGGTPTSISGRRDGYAIGWSGDGKGIIFVEGNAYQGESSALWRTDLTGHQRTKLVDGATL